MREEFEWFSGTIADSGTGPMDRTLIADEKNMYLLEARRAGRSASCGPFGH
ncbi:non-reducing end alpha-L-arabinofuranosidase family hydrolase [Streptomyces sp. NPDC058718]|uniref:non-reducing end alpha-L-arabinofuranosidase family hydrolase n=1 Tax=Streptomyces sp. NPDC058718 TaxID=3346610 RepID=UPI003675F2A5